MLLAKTAKNCSGIMEQRINQFIKNSPCIPTVKAFLNQLTFSDSEINNVEKATRNQCESEDWFQHKVGFVSAFKCEAVVP